MIYGYKCFNEGLVNRYGVSYQVGKIYNCEGNVKFGINGNGFHMCLNLEDTLRFFDSFNEKISICEVIGFGEQVLRNDEYNAYYDMYACSGIYIVKEMAREEIITYGLNLSEMRLIRFISSLKLTDLEKETFRNKFSNNELVNKYIDYYQDNIKTAFSRKLKK